MRLPDSGSLPLPLTIEYHDLELVRVVAKHLDGQRIGPFLLEILDLELTGNPAPTATHHMVACWIANRCKGAAPGSLVHGYAIADLLDLLFLNAHRI